MAREKDKPAGNAPDQESAMGAVKNRQIEALNTLSDIERYRLEIGSQIVNGMQRPGIMTIIDSRGEWVKFSAVAHLFNVETTARTGGPEKR